MEKNSVKEIKEKNKIYHKQKKRKSKYYLIGAVVIIYCFFFLSSLILPAQRTDKADTTPVGEPVPFAENRTVTLVDAKYSKEQELMEIVLHFTNQNYDNVNEYYYALTLAGASTKGMKVEEIYNEDLFTVLRVKDVPPKYTEMTILFAPKVVDETDITDEITGTVTLNKFNVTSATIELNKARTAYLAERMNLVIANYEKQLSRQKNKLEELQQMEAAIISENEEFEKNKKYMTDQEISEKELVIIEKQDTLVEVREDIATQKAKIQNTQDKIDESKKKLESFDW